MCLLCDLNADKVTYAVKIQYLGKVHLYKFLIVQIYIIVSQFLVSRIITGYHIFRVTENLFVQNSRQYASQ